MKNTFIGIVMSVMFCSVAFAADLKVGIIDLQRVLRESKTVQGYRQQFGKEIEAKRKLLVEKQKTALEFEEKLAKEGGKFSFDERRGIEEKLAVELKDLKRLREDMDMDLQKLDRELAQKALKEIDEIVGKVFGKDEYSLIIEKGAAGVIRFRGELDITEKILKLYDRK